MRRYLLSTQMGVRDGDEVGRKVDTNFNFERGRELTALTALTDRTLWRVVLLHSNLPSSPSKAERWKLMAKKHPCE